MDAGLVSCVIVIENVLIPHHDLINALDLPAEHWSDVELVIVANAVPASLALELKKLVEALPDCTCYFLTEQVDTYTAYVVGIDHAIGDYVLITNASGAQRAALPKMINAIRSGFDLVYAEPLDNVDHVPSVYGLTRRLFYAALNWMSDVELSPDLPLFRLMSRPAALHLSGKLNAELLLRARSLGSGYPAIGVPIRIDIPKNSSPSSLREGIFRGLHGLITTTAAPLRLASFLGLAAAGAAFMYTFYIIGVFFLKEDVAPGWTTLSLQIAGMTLLFSFVLALIAEYILQIHSRMPLRRRSGVTRELKSSLSRHTERTNVITEGGAVVGMPADLLPSPDVAKRYD